MAASVNYLEQNISNFNDQYSQKSFSTFLVDEENVKDLRGRVRLDMGQGIQEWTE